MLKLIPLLFVVVMLSLLSESFSRHDITYNRYEYKDRFIWIIIIVAIIIFAGTRTNYNDTFVYHGTYLATPRNMTFSDIDWTIGHNPGYAVTKMIFRHYGISFSAYIMFYTVITYSIYIWFIHKYSTNFFLSMLLFMFLVFTFPIAAMKQCMAIAFCLLAVDKAIHKKWVWFVLFLALAEMFHAYSFLYIVVPFLFFVPWQGRKTYFSVLSFLAIGLMLQPMMSTILNITESLGDDYTAEMFGESGVNPFRLGVSLVPLVLSFILRKKINSPEYEVSRAEGLFINLSIINGEIMFVALFGTANYFARLANYFIVFQTISLPRMFAMIDKKWRFLLVVVAIICYFLFFSYQNVIKIPFDEAFKRIPISEFKFYE